MMAMPPLNSLPEHEFLDGMIQRMYASEILIKVTKIANSDTIPWNDRFPAAILLKLMIANIYLHKKMPVPVCMEIFEALMKHLLEYASHNVPYVCEEPPPEDVVYELCTQMMTTIALAQRDPGKCI